MKPSPFTPGRSASCWLPTPTLATASAGYWLLRRALRGARLLLAKADGPEQAAHVGNQTGGRVGLFLQTDDFTRDHAAFVARGVRFLEPPRHEPYGTVAVFVDLYGNKWDLIEPKG